MDQNAPDVFSREFFHQLEDEINRARYEIDEKYHMGLAEVKARLAHIAGIDKLTVESTPRGDEIYILGDVTAIVQKGNNRNTMNYLAEKLSNPFEAEKQQAGPMSITGLKSGAFQGTIEALRQRLIDKQNQGAAKIAAAGEMGAAKIDEAVNSAEAKIDKEVSEVLQDFSDFTNGGPA